MDKFNQAKQIASGLTNFLRMKANIAAADIEEMHAKRYAICKLCPSADIPNDRCLECGCLLKLKTRSPESSCPLAHWKEVKKEG